MIAEPVWKQKGFQKGFRHFEG